MKENDVFACRDYKSFLRGLIESGRETPGYQSRLAELMGCQRSYLSRVLNGDAHLSQDQFFRLVSGSGFGDEATDFLMALLAEERADDPALKRHLRKRREKVLRRRESIAHRIRRKTSREEEIFLFHAHWLTSAVYMSTLLGSGRTPESLARSLGVDRASIVDCLGKLERLGIVRKSEAGYEGLSTDFHLERQSPVLPMYHRNWRERAVEDAGRQRSGSVHYTSLYTVSRKDAAELKELCLGWIEQSRKQALASRDEDRLVCFNLDLFTVTQNVD